MSNPRTSFLAAVAAARPIVAHPDVGDRWKEPSALAEMTVGELTAHLVRAVTNVDRYVQADPPEPPPDGPISGAAYLLPVEADLDSPDNVRVRSASSEEATAGQRAILGQLDRALERLTNRLPAEPMDRLVKVRGGEVLLLDDYLRTRIIELTVHTDDLCASLGRATPTLPGIDIAIAALIGVATLRHGDLAVLRALARRERDPDSVLRVI